MNAEEHAGEKPERPEKAHCPTCNRVQNCDLHGRIYKPWEWSDNMGNSTSGGVYHTLFECRGCDTVFYEKNSWDENEIDYRCDEYGEDQSVPYERKSTFPKPPSRRHPDWFNHIGHLHPTIFGILEETYKAYEEGSYILTSIGLRTALDSCVTAVKIDPAIPFSEKLKALLEGGWIGDTEHSLLTVLTDAGNAAAHQGWAPDEEETKHLLDLLENFIQRNLINGKRAMRMKDAIPQKQKRQKKMPPMPEVNKDDAKE